MGRSDLCGWQVGALFPVLGWPAEPSLPGFQRRQHAIPLFAVGPDGLILFQTNLVPSLVQTVFMSTKMRNSRYPKHAIKGDVLVVHRAKDRRHPRKPFLAEDPLECSHSVAVLQPRFSGIGRGCQLCADQRTTRPPQVFTRTVTGLAGASERLRPRLRPSRRLETRGTQGPGGRRWWFRPDWRRGPSARLGGRPFGG